MVYICLRYETRIDKNVMPVAYCALMADKNPRYWVINSSDIAGVLFGHCLNQCWIFFYQNDLFL